MTLGFAVCSLPQNRAHFDRMVESIQALLGKTLNTVVVIEDSRDLPMGRKRERSIKRCLERGADWVVVCNDYLLFEKLFARQLFKLIFDNPEARVFIPACVNADGTRYKDWIYAPSYGGKLAPVDKPFDETMMVNHHCFLMRRDIAERLQISPYLIENDGSDSLYFTRYFLREGLKVAYAKDAIVRLQYQKDNEGFDNGDV